MISKEVGSVFVNFSNHPSRFWCSEQILAAQKLCGSDQLYDYPFPNVDAAMNAGEVARLADTCIGTLMVMNPCCVMCQGEFTLTVAVVNELLKRNVPCYAACSERRIITAFDENGSRIKTVEFVFTQFRQYIQGISIPSF